MDLFFWLLLNLGVPIAGPLFMLALFAVTHGKAVARQLVVESVKNGQLFWSAIALSAAAIYEAAAALEGRKGPVPLLELAIAVFSLIAFTSSILVMLATLKGYGDRTAASDVTVSPAGPPVVAIPSLSSSAVGVSIWLTGGTLFLFGLLHAYVSDWLS